MSGNRAQGFSYKRGNRTVTVQRTDKGVTLIDGRPTDIPYNKLKAGARNMPGYTELSDADLGKKRENRSKDYNSHDYEHGLGKGGETRGKAKLVYRPRRGA